MFKSKSAFIFGLIFLFSLIFVVSAVPTTIYTNSYDGGKDDEAYVAIGTKDGGYALAGITNSFGEDYDFWLIKTDSSGVEQWNKTFGGPGDDTLMSMTIVDNEDFALVGSIKDSINGTWLDSNDDVWLVRIDSNGNMLWNRTFGGVYYDRAKSLVTTSDGGLILACETRSFGAGGADFWLIKTDSQGNLEWDMTYGGTDNEFASSVVETSDGGYAVTGSTIPSEGGNADFWLIKTDSQGNLEWSQSYGGDGTEYANSMITTKDGGYALAGSTTSFGNGDWDGWLVKTDSKGNLDWSENYGNEENEYIGSLVVNDDQEYVLACIQQSTFGDGFIWLAKTDSSGIMQWNQTYAISAHHSSTSIVFVENGDLVISASTRDSAETRDFWLLIVNEGDEIPVLYLILGIFVAIIITVLVIVYFLRKKS